jgi:hypothetical protein
MGDDAYDGEKDLCCCGLVCLSLGGQSQCELWDGPGWHIHLAIEF